MQHIYIDDMTPGIHVIGCYIISDLHPGITLPDGHDYWQILLSDKSGDIPAYVRECPAVQLDESDIGRVVFVEGTVSASEEGMNLSCSFESIECLDFDALSEKEMGYFLAAGPFEPYKLMRSVEAFVASIDDADYRALCQLVLENNRRDFLSAPATRSDHHFYAGGLLVHTEHMLHLVEYATALYTAEVFDRDLLLAGTLLHDMGRLREFTNGSNGDDVTGKPETHEVLGCVEVGRAATALNISGEKVETLKHIILAHHNGSFDPASAEVVTLRILNDLDAALETCRELAEVQA